MDVLLEYGYKNFEGLRNLFLMEDSEAENLLDSNELDLRIQLEKVPQEWEENQKVQLKLMKAVRDFGARYGLIQLIKDELDTEQEYLEEGNYKPLIVRQSGFLEDLLKFQCQLWFQGNLDRVLSNSEMRMLKFFGVKDLFRMANFLGIIDEDGFQKLSDLASHRNKLAHSSWGDFGEGAENQFENTAVGINEYLEAIGRSLDLSPAYIDIDYED